MSGPPCSNGRIKTSHTISFENSTRRTFFRIQVEREDRGFLWIMHAKTFLTCLSCLLKSSALFTLFWISKTNREKKHIARKRIREKIYLPLGECQKISFSRLLNYMQRFYSQRNYIYDLFLGNHFIKRVHGNKKQHCCLYLIEI